MHSNFKLSPSLFLTLQFFILLPSILFVLSLILWILARSSFLYAIVLTPGISFQNIGVLIVSPLSGGIFAYGYMERYKVQGRLQRISKIILFYSILCIGLILAYFISTHFS